MFVIAMLFGPAVPFESLLGAVRVVRVEGTASSLNTTKCGHWSVNQDDMRFAQELLAALQCTPEDIPAIQVRDCCL